MALGNEKSDVSSIKSPHSINRCTGLLFGLVFTGSAQTHAQSNYNETWSLGFGAPDYMEVWIETADVVDVRERLFRRAGSGIASVFTPSDNKGKPAGWPKSPGRGAGRDVTGADLPRLIYVAGNPWPNRKPMRPTSSFLSPLGKSCARRKRPFAERMQSGSLTTATILVLAWRPVA